MTATKKAYANVAEMKQARAAIIQSAAKAEHTASAAAIKLGADIHDHVWLSIECDPALVEIGHTQGAFRSVMKQLNALAAAELVSTNLTRSVQWYCLQEALGADLSKQSTQVLRKAERLLDFTGTNELYFSYYSPEALAFAQKHLIKEGKARLTGETIAELLYKLDKKRFADPNAKPKDKEETKPAGKEAPTDETTADATAVVAVVESGEPLTANDVVRQVRAYAAVCSKEERKLLFSELGAMLRAYNDERKQAHEARQARNARQVAAVA